MGTCKRKLDKEIILCLFAPVLFRTIRPKSKASLELKTETDFPKVNKPITLGYYLSSDGDVPLFLITYTPSHLSPIKYSVDFQYASQIEVSGPDITDEVLDRAVAEYQGVFQTPIPKYETRDT